MKTALQIELSFEQILELVKKLSIQEKLAISKALEKEEIESKISKLLDTFRTDELSLDIIDKEVEIVRQNIYEKH